MKLRAVYQIEMNLKEFEVLSSTVDLTKYKADVTIYKTHSMIMALLCVEFFRIF